MFGSLVRLARASFALVLPLAALLGASGAALAQQILEVYSDSLTTYKPSGNTTIQGVRLQHLQRGVTIDGVLRARPGFGMVLAGNPFENAWRGRELQGDL